MPITRLRWMSYPRKRPPLLPWMSAWEQAHDRTEEIHRSVRKVTQIRKHLTDTQFRRVWMYFVDGMTVDEIGTAEGVSHQNISKSIGAAMKKMKKLFSDC